METIVQGRRGEYYQRVGEADASGDCSGFIRYLLDAITVALRQVVEAGTPVETPVETPVKLPEQLLALLREAGRLRFMGPKKGGR